MLSTRRIRLLRSLVAGGIPALWAMALALSRRSPSLTAEYSGFIKNSTLSKYSHWVWVISTTCLLTPFIKEKSPFTRLFPCYFWQGNRQLFLSKNKDKYTICIVHFSGEKVENRVEKMDNSSPKPLF